MHQDATPFLPLPSEQTQGNYCPRPLAARDKDIITARAAALAVAGRAAANRVGVVGANVLRAEVRNARPCGTSRNKNAVDCTHKPRQRAHSSPAACKDGAQLLRFFGLGAYPRTTRRHRRRPQLRTTLLLAPTDPRAAAAPGSARDSDVLAVDAGHGPGHWPDTFAAPAIAANIAPPHGKYPNNSGIADDLARTIAHSL